MRLLHITAIAALGLSGCIIYDNDCPSCTGGGHGRADIDTGGLADVAPEPDFWLDPYAVEADASTIISMQSDQAIDFETVTEIDFLGTVEVCTTAAREDELLITVSVGEELGDVDMLIDFEDGTTVFVDNALTVIPAGGGGDDGGSDDGGGDDGGDDDGGDSGAGGSTGGSTGGGC